MRPRAQAIRSIHLQSFTVLLVSQPGLISDLRVRGRLPKSSRESISRLVRICLTYPLSEAQARRGEEAEYDPDQFQDPDNEYGLFAGTTYEADDEEADKIYEQVDENMDARRRARRYGPRTVVACRALTAL